jgi:hypothetical protein
VVIDVSEALAASIFNPEDRGCRFILNEDNLITLQGYTVS